MGRSGGREKKNRGHFSGSMESDSTEVVDKALKERLLNILVRFEGEGGSKESQSIEAN